jgi:hypothetical protein
VAVGVGEVAGVAAPDGVGAGLEDRRAGALRLGEDFVDFVLFADVVSECDAAETAGAGEQVRVLRRA